MAARHFDRSRAKLSIRSFARTDRRDRQPRCLARATPRAPPWPLGSSAPATTRTMPASIDRLRARRRSANVAARLERDVQGRAARVRSGSRESHFVSACGSPARWWYPSPTCARRARRPRRRAGSARYFRCRAPRARKRAAGRAVERPQLAIGFPHRWTALRHRDDDGILDATSRLANGIGAVAQRRAGRTDVVDERHPPGRNGSRIAGESSVRGKALAPRSSALRIARTLLAGHSTTRRVRRSRRHSALPARRRRSPRTRRRRAVVGIGTSTPRASPAGQRDVRAPRRRRAVRL